MKLDENQLKEFHENGFLVLKNFADTELCVEILEKTKSIKRLGMVLIENFIVKDLLKISNKDIALKLEAHLSNLGQSELNELLNIYKEFKKTNKIKSLEFLEKIL